MKDKRTESTRRKRKPIVARRGKSRRVLWGGRRIDVVFKGLLQAAEPAIDRDPARLDSVFWSRLQAALASLAGRGVVFKLHEGFRTTVRQQWLYGSGRPDAIPFGRQGKIVTNADGVNRRSKHQGNTEPGSGRAADCYPIKNGSVYIPPSSDAIWTKFAAAVEAEGLLAGHRWPNLRDSPHCEMP